jgi:predicted NAD/FAD-dependent oxidoreductase
MTTVVVGAGLAGLVAARRLADAGQPVTVLDKGRSPGGRLATRRLDTPRGVARLDHGAQFFTVRDPRFGALVDRWHAQGWVQQWCRGFGATDGHTRFAGTGGMNTLARRLAEGLDVRCGVLVFAIRPGSDGRAWRVHLDDGSVVEADSIIVTAPLPQAFSLLVTAEVTLPESLMRTDYDRTLALLMALDGPSAVPPPGGVQQPCADIAFVADNQAKGISDVPALTLHASPAWSLAHWDRDPVEVESALGVLAQPWLGDAAVVTQQVKRWRFATPQTLWPDACWRTDEGGGPLILAGDAFAGPRMEGAAMSGWAAAEALVNA